MEAGLAQLAARESHNLKVVGSSPTSRKSFAFLCNFLACRGRGLLLSSSTFLHVEGAGA